VVVCVLALVAFSCAQEDPDVLVLTSDNFDKTIEENNLILVEFYAPWCGHCKKLVPEYAKAATALKGIAPIAKVDADNEANRPLGERFGVRGFPTIKLFRNGQPTDYAGERTAEGITSFMKKQTMPAVSLLETEDAVKTFSGEDKVVIIGFFENTESPEYETFKETAEKLRDNFLFGAVVGKKDVNKGFEVTAPAVVLFKKFDEGKNVLDAASFATLNEFIKKNSVPLVDEIGPNNYKSYADSGLPLGYLFVDLAVEGQKDQYLEILKPFAISAKGKLNWVYIDWQKYAKHAERLGLSGKTVPAVAIENLEDGTHFAFDETADITAANLGAWVNKFLAKELEPTIKSEEVPAQNDGPVKVIVAKNFEEIVNDKTKDVLVEFYAPWCGHCKSLAPIWEELGTAMKQVPSIVVAKMDATANDVNPKFGIRGFPTIKFFPANDKQTPIDYDGDRSKADILKFIKEHASVAIDESTLKDEL